MRAISFVDDLVDRCVSLADAPPGFRLVPWHEQTGIRSRTYGTCLILYRLAADRNAVPHVLNGARDIETILFPDGGA